MKTFKSFFISISVFGLITAFLAVPVNSAPNTSDTKTPASKTPAPKTATSSSDASPQDTRVPTALMPEVVGAKAFLEDLLVRRYSQELGATVDRQAFSLGAQLELVEVPKQPDPYDDDETPADLLLGTLDPEELLKKYAGADGTLLSQVFLKNYRISSVNISVGLKDSLSPEVKSQVEKWLTGRLSLEFGKVGKGSVSLIQAEKKAPPSPKTFLDWLSQFQNFAGQLVLALAIILGILLWKMMASKDSKNKAEEQPQQQPLAPQAPAPAKDEKNKNELTVQEKEEAERTQLVKQIKQFTKQIVDLNPKFTAYCEPVMRTWCLAGEEGKFKLACFAEAVGKEMGKLPIPVDALQDLTKIFTKMPDLGLKEKLGYLQKIYWDVLTVINLGPESLEEPFGYLTNLNSGMVNKVLIDENPKMKAVVSLYMPASLRDSYMQSLNMETKRSLLEAAAQMTEIATEELKSIDGTVKGKLRPDGAKGSISLNMGLTKLIASLTPLEEITILPGMKGPAFDEFKRTVASIAFLDAWSDEKLATLMSRAMPDEVTAFLRVRPDLKDKLMSFAPEMTAEVVKDEISRPDTTSDKDKNRILSALANRLNTMVKNKEVDLSQMFPAPAADAATGTPGQTEQKDQDDIKKAA